MYGIDPEDDDIIQDLPSGKKSGIMRTSLDNSKQGSKRGRLGALNEEEDIKVRSSVEKGKSSLPRKLVGSATIHINEDSVNNSVRKK